MTLAKEFLGEYEKILNKDDIPKHTQYRKGIGWYSPTGQTESKMKEGIYKFLRNASGGVDFDRHILNTDKLLRFKDERLDSVLSEIELFWQKAEEYKKLGFTHKRGILLYGAPGTGKSCITKLAIKDTIENDGIVFIGNANNTMVEGLRIFREIEPNRRVICIIEDIDEAAQYNERELLSFFDGDNQVDGMLILATTNYLNKMSERFLRPGRFDRKINIPYPPLEGRIAFLQKKLGLYESEDLVKEYAEKTNGFSFGQLREFLISVYCLNSTSDKAINRLKKGGIEEKYTDEDLADAMLKLVLDKKGRLLGFETREDKNIND